MQDFSSIPLFEISWEVCNKVGGIHTVITSKLREATKHFLKYYTIGNYKVANKEYFIEKETPPEFLDAKKKLEEIGIKIHFGVWQIETNPECILVDYSEFSKNTNEIKKLLWDNFQIDSLNSSWYDFDEPIIWSYACGEVVCTLCENNYNFAILHAHEWMSGGAIFNVKIKNNNKIKTIFTTHATMLGRAISGNNLNLYSLEENISPLEFAYKLGVHTKFQTEKALANISDVFTTVSDITSKEAEIFFSKKVDFILYNGFNTKHMQFNFLKERIELEKTLDKFFYNSYQIDFSKTQVIYTSGRNEFRNKGIDILIDALSKLNEKLTNENSSKTIVCLILIPIGEFELDELIIENINSYNNNKKRKNLQYAPLSTHKLPLDNQIISRLIKNKLLNKKEDKVKIVLCPMYLDSKDGFFNKKYYEVVCGCDLGVFPSFYEPWGYTPLESISCSVPAITTNLAGFGFYIRNQKLNNCFKYENEINCCVEILDRVNKDDDLSANELFEKLYNFTKKDTKELYLTKIASNKLSEHFDWENFYKNYIKVYKFVLTRNI